MTAPGPLFFHHVPKTGGTSLTEAIRMLVPAGLCFTECNYSLSLAFVERLLADGLKPSQFIHGHPEYGVGELLRGKTRMITVLREPAQQIVSHFLAIPRDPSNTMHAAAAGLGFRRFLAIHKHFLIYQTMSLMAAIGRLVFSDPKLDSADGVATSLPLVFDYLGDMSLVGTLDHLDEFFCCLAEEMGWPRVPELRRLNEAPPPSRPEAAELLAILTELERDPELSLLLTLERSVYLKALSMRDRGRQLLSARRRFAVSEPPETALLAHAAADGRIMLGANFERAEPLEDGSPAWWTGERQQSWVYARLAGGRRRIAMQVRRWQFVRPAAIAAFVAGRQVPLTLQVLSDTVRRLEIDLDAAAPLAAGGFVEIVLRMRWSGAPMPDTAPFYPRVTLCKFEFA